MTKLKWGMIGGGEGSQIGTAHRLGALADGLFEFSAAALDNRPDVGRTYAKSLGVSEDRAYGDWKEMLTREKNREDRIDLVTVATPNSTHFEITKSFLEAGFNVLCEKPMTMTVDEGEEIVKIASKSRKLCTVNYGHHGNAEDANNPRVRWRYDPQMAGVSGQFADCGIHALHMASFIGNDEVESVSADFASTIKGRELEDDAMVNFRMSSGIVGRLWTSSVAIGRQHGFDIQVFGEKAGLKWKSEHPNQLIYSKVGNRTEIIEKGENNLCEDALRLSRVAIAHPEGFPLAVANIYVDIAATLKGDKRANLPTASDGLRSMAAVYSATVSAKNNGKWTDARPPMFR